MCSDFEEGAAKNAPPSQITRKMPSSETLTDRIDSLIEEYIAAVDGENAIACVNELNANTSLHQVTLKVFFTD